MDSNVSDVKDNHSGADCEDNCSGSDCGAMGNDCFSDDEDLSPLTKKERNVVSREVKDLEDFDVQFS